MKAKSSTWATGGALLTAVLSSACCWLPLLLLAFGASAAGVGSFFEAYRPYLLGATAILLAGAFYTVYFRDRCCDAGDACSAPNPRIQRLNKTLLWVTTIFVIGFALFPNYIGRFLGAADTRSVPMDRNGLTEFVVDVEGMTCEACAVHTQANLKGLPGVKDAIVSYDDKKATVFGDPQVTEGIVRQAVEAAGYKAPNIATTGAEQGGADQPATAPESKSEGDSKPKPESEVRPQ